MEGVSGFFTSWHSPELQIRCYSTRKGGGNTQFLARFSFDSSTLLSQSPESQRAQSSKRSSRCESSGYKCLTPRNSWKESEANEIVAPPARPAKFPAKYTRYLHCVQEYAQAGAGSRGIGRQVRAQIQRKQKHRKSLRCQALLIRSRARKRAQQIRARGCGTHISPRSAQSARSALRSISRRRLRGRLAIFTG